MAEGSRIMQFDRHMSDNEALMWNLEKDPALSSWFASLTILDRTPEFERLRLRLAHGVIAVPRLKQRVLPSVGRLSPPMWVDDPEFDLDYHVRRVAVPSPGGERELYDLAMHLLLDPFERTRPLWQFVLIEGLEGGRAALFQKMHHAITDGEGGVRLAEEFIELTPDAPDPDPVEIVVEPEFDRFADSLREVVRHNTRRMAGMAERAVQSFVRDPNGTVESAGAVLSELGRALAGDGEEADGQVGSPIWQPRTLKRWYGTIRVPFDDAKRAAKAHGGTINDFFVAGALAGSAAYHAERGVEVDKLRVAMPVSTRSAGTAGGNSFALTTNDLRAPVDPVEAFGIVHEGLAAAKSGGAVDILGSLSMVINLLPTSILTSFAKEQAASVDFTVSNVRGAPIDLYIAGAKCEATFPMGPISGCGFNLTTMSYAGSLDMGLVADAGAIEDPQALRDAIAGAYEKIVAG